MASECRYAEWRSVALRRIPALWIGMALGGLIAVSAAFFTRLGGHLWFTFAGFIAHRTSTFLTERRLRHLRDDPEGGQFAVTLRLKREVAYGFDEGLLAFEGGWLVYSGRQCSFSVRREDVFGLAVESKRYGFVFGGPFGRHMAFFEAADERSLGAAFRAWWRADYVAGAAVYPPVSPNREAWTLHRSWESLGLLAFAFLLVDASRQTKLHERGFIDALAFALLPIALFYGIQSRLALKRIAAGLPRRRYRLVRLARLLGIRLLRRSDAKARSAAFKANADTTNSESLALVHESGNDRSLAGAMLDTIQEEAVPMKDETPNVERQHAKTQQ